MHPKAKNNTPAVKQQTKPVVTVKADGQVVCNCRSYRAAAAMYGAGYCSHVAQMRTAEVH
jgi:hypothetical protein